MLGSNSLDHVPKFCVPIGDIVLHKMASWTFAAKLNGFSLDRLHSFILGPLLLQRDEADTSKIKKHLPRVK